MTKLIGYETKNTLVTKEIICDMCGTDCLNTFIDILLKMSFSENPELFKTICYNCYEQNYKDDHLRMKTKRFEAQAEYSKKERS